MGSVMCRSAFRTQSNIYDGAFSSDMKLVVRDDESIDIFILSFYVDFSIHKTPHRYLLQEINF